MFRDDITDNIHDPESQTNPKLPLHSFVRVLLSDRTREREQKITVNFNDVAVSFQRSLRSFNKYDDNRFDLRLR